MNPYFVCSVCNDITTPVSRGTKVAFYHDIDFLACSEECYDLAREHDLQNAFVLRMMEEEWV